MGVCVVVLPVELSVVQKRVKRMDGLSMYWFECWMDGKFISIGIRAVHLYRAGKILESLGAENVRFHLNENAKPYSTYKGEE